jgi:hypothetical protein
MHVPQGVAGGLADALEPEAADADIVRVDQTGPASLDAVAAATDGALAGAVAAPFAGEDSVTEGNISEGLSSESTRVLDGPSLTAMSASSFGTSAGVLPAMEGTNPAGRQSIPEMPTVITGESAPQSRRSDTAPATFEPTVVHARTSKSMETALSAITAKARVVLRQFSTAPPQRKAIMLGVPLGVLLLAIIAVAMSGGPPPVQKQWVSAPASMWNGPAAQRGYIQIDTLGRGEEVVFLHEVYGDYSLVRDIWGRVGYINRESISDTQPPVTPEVQFPGCRQAPVEPDKEPCETRARATHDACGSTCAADSRCLARCQDRFVECIDGCKTRLTVPAPPVVAETTETPETAEPAVEGAEAGEGAEDPAEAADARIAEKPIKGGKAAKALKGTKKVTGAKNKRTKH